MLDYVPKGSDVGWLEVEVIRAGFDELLESLWMFTGNRLKKVYARFAYNKEDCGERICVYALSDGFRIDLLQRELECYGLAQILKAQGYELIDDSYPVFQFGEKIGRVPGDFRPERIKSKSFFYEPRPGDFTFKDDHWEASKTLCPGDFDAIPGFTWERNNG